MDSAPWIEILRREVDSTDADGKRKGPATVAKEIGYSRATVDLVCKGTYAGNLDAVAERVMSIYGCNGKVECPVLGVLSPQACAENWQRAKTVGLRVGNPETLKLHHKCLRCSKRN
jgi:hypothetical protein